MRKVYEHMCVHTQAHTPNKRTAPAESQGQERGWRVHWIERRPVGMEHSVLEWETGEAGEQAKTDHAWPCQPQYGECHAGSGRGVPRCDYIPNRSLCYVKSRFGGTILRHSCFLAAYVEKIRLLDLAIYPCTSSVHHHCHEASRVCTYGQRASSAHPLCHWPFPWPYVSKSLNSSQSTSSSVKRG